MIGLWLLLLVANGSYDHRVFGVGPDEFKRVFMAGAQLAGITAIVAYLADIGIARGFLAVAAPIGTLGLLLDRYFARKYLHRLRRNGEWSHRVLIVGDLVRAARAAADAHPRPARGAERRRGLPHRRHRRGVRPPARRARDGRCRRRRRVDHAARLRHRRGDHLTPLRPGCAAPPRLVARGLRAST